MPKPFEKGDKLRMLTRHQEKRFFAPTDTIAEVVEITERLPHKMRVRIYRHDHRANKGCLAEFLRVTDEVWLDRIGIRKNKDEDETTNLPHVHQIIGKLTDEEFEELHSKMCE